MIEDLYKTDCIRTYTGLYMNVFEPTPDMICIVDISHALSHQCRFGGHISKFYSVAQHSVLCETCVCEKYKMEALLHDASEAYLMDIPTPIKARLNNYKEIENRLMKAISEKFNFQFPIPDAVKETDKKMLELEWEALIIGGDPPCNDFYWKPQFADTIFLKHFQRIEFELKNDKIK